jgi:hypothetical protein
MVVYMSVDNAFCSLSCREEHLRYIINFDPDLNYPDKWNANNNYTKVDCVIEVDYINFHKSTTYKHNLYKSQSLIKLLNHKCIEKKLIMCVKMYIFNIKLINKIKFISICLLIILITRHLSN